MALSGTLETFSLPDVLRLLSSTKKTGRLALDGDRGRGRIWVRDGEIVAAEADRAAHEQVEGVAFELLRFTEATFEFESGAETSTDGTSHLVDEVLAEAEVRLAEWREIEAVVPSLDVWVRMVDELDAERTVAPEQWRVLARVGTGSDGHALSEHLGQGEYEVCRQLRDLVVEGMVELAEAPVEAPAPRGHIDVDAAWDAPAGSTFVEPALDPEAVSSLGAGLASFVAVGTVEEPVLVDFIPAAAEEPGDEVLDDEVLDEVGDVPDEAPSAFEAMVDTGAHGPWEAVEPAEDEPLTDDHAAEEDDFLSQLSQLSPKAAAAVEATWAGEPEAPAVDEEPEPLEAAADDAIEPAEAPAPAAGDDIDQNLLLRFLSSAKS